MSMTAVPISIRFVRAPTAASSGNGDASCRAKWRTRVCGREQPWRGLDDRSRGFRRTEQEQSRRAGTDGHPRPLLGGGQGIGLLRRPAELALSATKVAVRLTGDELAGRRVHKDQI